MTIKKLNPFQCRIKCVQSFASFFNSETDLKAREVKYVLKWADKQMKIRYVFLVKILVKISTYKLVLVNHSIITLIANHNYVRGSDKN